MSFTNRKHHTATQTAIQKLHDEVVARDKKIIKTDTLKVKLKTEILNLLQDLNEAE